MDLKGENAFQVTNMPNGACQPSWSPDGTRLVFISPCRRAEEVYTDSSLYIINADGSGLVTLDASPGGNFDPAWSPDGQTIAFTSLRTGQMEIFLVDADDPSQSVQITQGGALAESRMPAWSPDSLQIVYVVRRLNVYQIWMMNADGSDPVQIVRSGLAFTDYLPDWSPRNDLIVFNQRCAKTFCNPYLLSVPATDRRSEQGLRLPFNLVYIENINFSPDGYYIAYEGAEESGNIDVYFMTISGGDRVRLSTGSEGDFDPAWRPALQTP